VDLERATEVNAGPPGGLRDALLRLDLRLRLRVDAFRDELAERARDPFRGLCVSDADVDKLLAGTPAADVARSLLAEPPGAVAPRLARLASLFALDSFEQEAILISLAPELDLRYERLYAYLQDDVTRKRPTVDLILRLLEHTDTELPHAREALGPGGRLARRGLLVAHEDPALPLLSRAVRPDPRLVEYLVGSDELDARLLAVARLVLPSHDGHEGRQTDNNLVRLLSRSAIRAGSGPLVYLQGAFGADKLGSARAACSVAGQSLLVVDIASVLRTARPEFILGCAAREALLQGAVLAIDGVDQLLRDPSDGAPLLEILHTELTARQGVTLLLGEQRWEPATWCADVPSVSLALSTPAPEARAVVWHRYLDGRVATSEALQLAERYRLDDAGVRAVAAAAEGHSLWRGASEVEPEDVRLATRAIAAPPLEGLAVRISPRYEWSDIVLTSDAAAQLNELCSRARYQSQVLGAWGYGRKLARRAGLTGLFAGPPGTGKTMSAEIIAGSLGLELYRIDLSAIVSKYIGETEKNLERIFRAADQGDAVLLFDEADALFGKRSEVRDAHDRYANVEVAYLLQRLEVYEGVAILTTNLRGNIDEAFLRRLDCVLEFPLPEEPERRQIWRRSVPPEAPLASDVDLQFLARKFKLAGGHIRNIALTAAYLAASDGGPIAMKHLVRATRREYQKLGKLAVVSDFEQYFDLLNEADPA
jgi:hypothetical protein